MRERLRQRKRDGKTGRKRKRITYRRGQIEMDKNTDCKQIASRLLWSHPQHELIIQLIEDGSRHLVGFKGLPVE